MDSDSGQHRSGDRNEPLTGFISCVVCGQLSSGLVVPFGRLFIPSSHFTPRNSMLSLHYNTLLAMVHLMYYYWCSFQGQLLEPLVIV